MEYIRQWKVGDKTFGSKEEAQKYEAVDKVGAILENARGAEDLIAHADEVIALLRPFATRKPRKPRTNGTEAKVVRSVPRQAPKAEATTG